MLSIIIQIVSAMIPIGLIIFYFLINRSQEKPVKHDKSTDNDDRND